MTVRVAATGSFMTPVWRVLAEIEAPSLAELSISWPPVHSVTVRDDLRALEGYHSPQVDVRVRLNTNEAPTPPPAAWRDAFAAELSRVEWNRYPDRSASALRASHRRVASGSPRPGVRGQRFERSAADPAADVCRSGTACRHVRTDLSIARPHCPAHRRDGDRRRTRARLPVRTSMQPSTSYASAGQTSPSCARRTTRPVWSSRGATCRSCSPRSLGSWSSTRRTHSSPTGRR